VSAPEPSDPSFEARIRTSFAKQGLVATLGASITNVAPGAVEISAKCEGDLVPRGAFDFCPLPDYLGFGFRFIFTPLQAQRSDSGLLPRLGLT
jgi:hypothetical protein